MDDWLALLIEKLKAGSGISVEFRSGARWVHAINETKRAKLIELLSASAQSEAADADTGK